MTPSGDIRVRRRDQDARGIGRRTRQEAPERGDGRIHRRSRTGEAGRRGHWRRRMASPPFTSARRQWNRWSDGARRAGGPPEDEPERLRRVATGEGEQRVADRDRRGERHAVAGFRVGPADRAEVHGDVAHVRPRGADRLRDDAFAIDPANRRGGDRLGADGDGGLLRRPAPTRGRIDVAGPNSVPWSPFIRFMSRLWRHRALPARRKWSGGDARRQDADGRRYSTPAIGHEASSAKLNRARRSKGGVTIEKDRLGGTITASTPEAGCVTLFCEVPRDGQVVPSSGDASSTSDEAARHAAYVHVEPRYHTSRRSGAP